MSERPLPWHLLPDTAAVGGDGWLEVGGCSVADLVAEFGTPLFAYDEEHLRARCREAAEAFPDGAAYATKAFLCRAMARLAHEEGLALDVASGGELHVALDAGVPGDRLVLHGNNKSADELARALAAEVAEGYSAGAVDYVTKPFDPDDLIERIQRVLDGGHRDETDA